jgi:hypothetical protein
MARRLALVVSIALCALVLPGAAPPTVYSPGAPGVGDPYYPLDGNGGYDVLHYDLDLTYDPETDELSGTATIEARATQNLSAFNLDFVGLTVESVEVNGAAAGWTRDDHELTIAPASGIKDKADFTVEIAYNGVPETLPDFGESGFLHTDDGAVIVGEPHGAATWYPANDHPTDKASFTFHWTVPEGLEAVANGVLVGQVTDGGWTTWTWDAVDPMATYLATVSIGQLDIDHYKARGLPYWDAFDPALFEPFEPPPPPEPIVPTDGAALLFSQVADGTPSYKRLTRVIEVPAGGANLTFDTFHDTEGGWDFLFVETRTAGGDDWTTLPETNGFTSQDVGACPDPLGPLAFNPFLEHYLTRVLVDPGDPENPDDDEYTCDPSGTSGDWWAVSGEGFEWETWSVDLPNEGADAVDLEVSITYASDEIIQGRGVTLDNLVVSTGEGSTSFEADGDIFDGWVVGDPPEGSGPNENSWIVDDIVEPPPPEPEPPLILPTDGAQMLFSQQADSAYKRLTRVLDVPPGGSMLTFDVFHDTEEAFDFLFVEARTAGGDDWTTLEEETGFTNQDTGACPGVMFDHPFLEHYRTATLIDPENDEWECAPAGTSGDWWAISGSRFDWEPWVFALPNEGSEPIQLEVSITYASDGGFQQRGVTLDNLVVSSGSGSTSFEDDGDTLDGWVVADPPAGSPPNENSWMTIGELQPPPPPDPPGIHARDSFARQPEIIDFLTGVFGTYPFRASGGIVDNVSTGFALETQTRPVYSPVFFFGGPNYDVVVHELAHQWVGDSLAVEQWQHIWLNEGFATYAEWMWAAYLGDATEDEIFDFFYNEVFPADATDFWDLPIGDPGTERLFDSPVYYRGAMTLHVLRMQVGDRDFLRILQRWAREQAGGTVTTDEFITLAEHVSHPQLDELFDTWLFSTTRPELNAAAIQAQRSIPKGKAKEHVRDAVRPMLERLKLGHKAEDHDKRSAKGLLVAP